MLQWHKRSLEQKSPASLTRRVYCVRLPACTAAWRTEKQDGWRRKWLLTPDSSRDSTNKRMSEQTGLTAGPGSFREAVKTTRPRVWGREAGVEEGRAAESLRVTQTFISADIQGLKTAPYSRSSSSYHSLYLLLLNLKDKTGISGRRRTSQ